MKIYLDMTGSELAKPDYAMLLAGLAAAQANTPTATASEVANARLDLTEALTLLFGDRVTGSKQAAALHGSFNPVTLPDDNEDGTER